MCAAKSSTLRSFAGVSTIRPPSSKMPRTNLANWAQRRGGRSVGDVLLVDGALWIAWRTARLMATRGRATSPEPMVADGEEAARAAPWRPSARSRPAQLEDVVVTADDAAAEALVFAVQPAL
jgi:hypothetical protein